jgi:hypothetical protein
MLESAKRRPVKFEPEYDTPSEISTRVGGLDFTAIGIGFRRCVVGSPPCPFLVFLVLLSALDNSWFVATILGTTLAAMLWTASQAGQSTAALLRATSCQAQAD